MAGQTQIAAPGPPPRPARQAAGWHLLDLVVVFCVGLLIGLLALAVLRSRSAPVPAVPGTPADLLEE